MARVVTASEVDRLHQQVAELQAQFKGLQESLIGPNPAQTPARPDELFDANQFLSDAEPVVDGTRAAADNIVDEIAGD